MNILDKLPDAGTLNTFMLIVCLLYAAVMMAYIVSWFTTSNAVRSFLPQRNRFQADFIYYLPTATAQLNCNITLKVVRSIADRKITEISVTALTADASITIVPDTAQQYGLKYNSNPFMNDVIKIAADTSGLLTSFSLTSEDRIASILEKIGEIPSKITAAAHDQEIAIKGEIAQNSTVQLLTRTATFHISAEEIGVGKAIRTWLVTAEDETSPAGLADASLEISFDPAGRVQQQSKENEGTTFANAILTRPLVNMPVEIKLIKQPDIVARLEMLIPDQTKIVEVPVRRSAFITRTNTPEFQSGLLKANSITKPSEVESFIAIPVTVLKAIFSIPAQLWTFREENKYKAKIAELTIEKKMLELQKEVADKQAALKPKDDKVKS